MAGGGGRPVAAGADDGEVPFLYAVLDRVIEAYGGADRATELSTARAEFEARRGRTFEDEPLWEDWSQAFLEWYAVERPLAGGLAPAARARTAAAGRERAALSAWLTSQRVLAEVRGLGAGRVELVDRLGGATFAVAEERALHGVRVGDLAEVRLIGFEDAVRFGRTFVYYPRGARAAILARAAAGGVALLDELAALRVKTERYRHVDPARVYLAELGRAAIRG